MTNRLTGVNKAKATAWNEISVIGVQAHNIEWSKLSLIFNEVLSVQWSHMLECKASLSQSDVESSGNFSLTLLLSNALIGPNIVQSVHKINYSASSVGL